MFLVQDHLPCRDQDELQIEKWFCEYALVGVIVAVRNTQAGFEHYNLDEIAEFSTKSQKVFFTKSSHGTGGSSYRFDGRSTWAPKGQTHCVIPTPVITELALQHVSWMYGRKSAVHAGPHYPQDFEIRARNQYQVLFPDWNIERAKALADKFRTCA